MLRVPGFSTFAVASFLTLVDPGGHALAQADAPAEAAARKAFEQGRNEYDRGHFAEALAAYERAYSLSGRPALLFNIGRAAESDGQVERALEAYDAYLQRLPTAENREFVEARIAKLREAEARASAAAPAPAPAPVHANVAPKDEPREAAPPSSARPSGRPRQTVELPPPYIAPVPVPAPATESPSPSSPRAYERGLLLSAGLRGAVGGELKVDDNEGVDLEPTPGVELGASYAWPYFALGGELRVSWVEADGDDTDGEPLVDLSFKPRGRYVLPTVPLELYGALPVGPSLSFFEYNDKHAGFNVALLAGATYYLRSKLGLNAELGWQWHRLAYSSSAFSGYDGTLKLGQFVLAAHAVFAL